MAYQPKSYKKFVATAATATLVASAVVPVASASFTDVNSNYTNAVDYLVQHGIANGFTETTFGITADIKRGDAAVMIANALGLDTDAAADQGFTDLNTRVAGAVNAIVEAGIANGKTETTFAPDLPITRQEVAKMLANAYGLTATTDAEFEDVNSNWMPYVSALVEAEVAFGYNDTTFGSTDKVTRGQFALFVYRAEGSPIPAPAVASLDINAEGDEFTLVFGEALPEGADLNYVLENYDIQVNGSEITEAQVTALDLKLKSASADMKTVVVSHTDLDELATTLGGTSVSLQIGGKSDVHTFDVELKVLDFVAANQKEHFVTFNNNVDELTASNEANYELKLNNAVVNPASYTIEVDKDNAKKVNITLTDAAANSISNGSFLTLTVSEDVLDSKLKPLAAEFTKTITFNDTMAPTVSSVEVDGDDLVVTFNDFVKSVGLVSVNGVNKNAVVSGTYSKEVIVTDGALNLANGTYSVQFANVADIASPSSNVNSFTSGNFTLSDDVTVPSVEKLTQVDNDTLKVVFNKSVSSPTVTVKRNGLPLTVAVNATAKGNEYTVDLSNNGVNTVYDANATSTTVAVEVSAYKDSNNTVGNAYATNFTFNKDTVAPSVVTRFNTVTDDASQIVLRDKDGVRQSATASVVADADGDNTILRIATAAGSIMSAGDVVSGTYNITLGAGTVEDLEGNANVSTNVSIVKSASAAGSVSASAVASGSTITVNYGADMSTTATTVGNYRLNNAALPAGSVLYFNGNKQTVVIELPAGSISSSGQAALTITESVVSETGAKVASANRNLVTTGAGLTDNVKPSLLSAKKTNSTSIELTFAESLSAVADAANTQDDFIVKINGVTFAVTAVTDGTAGDNKVTLTVPSYNVNQTVTVTTAASSINVADVAGNTVKTGTAVTASN